MVWSWLRRTATRPPLPLNGASSATSKFHKAIYLRETATPNTDDCPEKPSENDYEKIVDNIIQWSETMEQAFFRICSILSHCNKNGMVFSPYKFMFAKETVAFAGFEITKEGIKPTDKYIEAELPNTN
jgi:hypothetical protein